MCQVSGGVDSIAATQVVIVTGLSIAVRLVVTVADNRGAIRCDAINFSRSIGFGGAIGTIRFCSVAHDMMTILFDDRAIGFHLNVTIR